MNQKPINPFNPQYVNAPSWLYYLFGALFLVGALVCLFLAFKYKNSQKEYLTLINTFGWFKRIWFSYRYHFFLFLTIIFLFSAIIFFIMNDVLLKR